MGASPWTVRRRCWRSVGSVQVVVGSVIEWRRMAWSPGVISSYWSVPLRTAHSRGRFRGPLRSGVVQCCGQSSIVVMGWVRGSVRGLSCVVGADGAWGISSSGCCGAFGSWRSALMVAKKSGRVGEAGRGGGGSFLVMWHPAGFSESCCMVMAAVASSSGVHRCGLSSRGWRVMVWRCFQLWNARRAWRPCLVSRAGGGRSWLPLRGRRPWCLFRCLPRVGGPPCPTHCRFLSPASTPGGLRGPLGGLVGRIGSTARRPWGGLGCPPVWRRCPFRGGGGGGVAARSGSFRWCSAFLSAVDAGGVERGGMGWSGSCGSVGCWWASGRGAVVASRC